ncbi:MAG: hypothetical protein PVSMB4_14830 [Ktedonobacterales bacterium]
MLAFSTDSRIASLDHVHHANFIYYDIADLRVADMVRIGDALAAPNAQELASCDVLQQEH